MPQHHLIRLLDDHHAQWLAVDPAGRVLSGPTAGLPSQPAERVTVLVPSTDVLLLEAPRLARRRHQLEQAIPYAIEDRLVTPVEQAHVAVLDDGDPDAVRVAVVDARRMEAWLERLAAQGVRCDRLLPEGGLLDWQAGPELMIEGDRTSLRHAAAGLVGGTLEEVRQGLPFIAGQSDAEPLRCIGAVPADLEWPGGVERDARSVPEYLAARLVAADGDALDLLQGRFRVRHQATGHYRGWRWAAVLLLGGVLTAAGSMLVERLQLDGVHRQQRAQMEEVLRQAIPDVGRVVDPRAQLLGELARRSGAAGNNHALDMLAQLAPLLAGGNRQILDGIEYRGGVMELTLRGDGVAVLDELRERVESLGLQAELVAMTPGSEGVEGRLRIRGGGA